LTILEWLAHHFKHIPVKLRQLIEKEHAAVCEADLPRAWDAPTAG
jgi:hypothetical protein